MAEWAFTTSKLLRELKHQAMVKSCYSTPNTHLTCKCFTQTTWRTKMVLTNKTLFKDAVVLSPSTSCPTTNRFPVPRVGASEAALLHSYSLFHSSRIREHFSMFDLNSTPHSKNTRYHTRASSNRQIEFKVGKASSKSMLCACFKI